MKRRKFLKSTGKVAAAAPFLMNGISVQSYANSPIFRNAQENDKILVLIRLGGGNDGLNMVIPLDQYDALANVRGNIILPQTSIITATDTVGLHPSMTGISNMYQDGNIHILQSVGYPDQNRSHFRSTDIWNTGTESNVVDTRGWLGKWMDTVYDGFPAGYPNAETPDPIAISMKSKAAETCQGVNVNYSMAVPDPLSLTLLNLTEEGTIPDSIYGEELAFLRSAFAQTNNYSDALTDIANNGQNMGTYPETDLAEQLKNIALLISGGCQTKVYVAEINGFDNHGSQVDFENTTLGIHADLLTELSEAISAFHNDIKLQGFSERVLGMTYSEFGRRIRSNDSFGTDHGTAAPLIVFGDCVNPEIYGDNPIITEDVSDSAGVPMQFDFRSVYASILIDWFDVEPEDIADLLFEEYQHLPIIQGCTATNQDEISDDIKLQIGPNPFKNQFAVKFELAISTKVSAILIDVTGRHIANLQETTSMSGHVNLEFNVGDIASGTYFVNLRLGDKSVVRNIIKY